MEAGMRRAALDARVGHKPSRGRSEKSRLAWRNDPVRDEKIFNIINTYLRNRQPIRLTSKASHSVCAARKNLRSAKVKGERIIPEIGLPHWDHSSELLKMIGWGLASKELQATPFTLRLSEKVIRDAKASPRGFGRYLQDRLGRHLRQRLPDHEPAFWFAAEQGVRDEPHLHGAVVIPEGARDEVLAALMVAGGAWRSPERQCSFGRPGNLIKWVGYCTKWLFSSGLHIADGTICKSVTGASQTVRREAKRCYQEARARSLAIYP